MSVPFAVIGYKSCSADVRQVPDMHVNSVVRQELFARVGVHQRIGSYLEDLTYESWESGGIDETCCTRTSGKSVTNFYCTTLTVIDAVTEH